ncbi:hypothetical protein M0804_005896 [Polistes exclamans]|nr:hypothetical protein M0804_005896 [Polistes exclamans]
MATEENKIITSLSIIAQEYDSDVDTEDNESLDASKNLDLNKNEEVLGYANTNTYRVPAEESSNNDSDSDSDSSDSDSDSNSSDSDSDSTSDSDSSSSSESDENNSIPKDKNTIIHNRKRNEKKKKSELDDLPTIKDLKISVSEDLCDFIGKVSWIVDSSVVVHPIAGKPTLNLDTVLFVDKGRKTLGRIEDVFGQVSDPHYSVRFNSLMHIKENGIYVGMEVYYCPNSPYTSLVFLHELVTKGIDAETDTLEDGEVPDFSDDEEELKYYEMQKKAGKETINSDGSTVPYKRERKLTYGLKTNHPWNRNTKKKFQGRKSQVRNNDSPSTSSNLYNPSQRPPSFANSNYSNNRFYEYLQYSNNLQANNTNNTLIPNPRIPFGMFPRFQSNSSTSFNGHNPFSISRIRFPRADLYLQSQPNSYTTSIVPFVSPSPYLFPSPYLTTPPPPPPLPSHPSSSIEQNHDTSQ